MSTKSKLTESVRVPVQADPTVYIKGYIDSRDIRICFIEEGFLHEGLFRYLLNKGEHGKLETRGPVKATVFIADEDAVRMDIEIELKNGAIVRKNLSVATCDEIEERLDQVRAVLHTYRPVGSEKPASSKNAAA